ncbi:MAG TPA: hypothetical protein VN738_05125 [Acidothermaceae bacterium]|nr:hypothetical protein [Acidothermaceae bacterium]
MLARIRKYQSNDAAPDVPVVIAAEAELARLSALLGVTGGQLAKHQRLVEEACDQITGYSLHDDGSISLHFKAPTPLLDLLAASIALRENFGDLHAVMAGRENVVDLVPPETTR